MALILVAVLILLSCESRREYLEVSKIRWLTDLNKALEVSKSTGKPIFLYFSARWCSWCREYEEDLEKEEVVEVLRRNFVPLLLDSDRNRDLFVEFGGRGTPFTVVLDPRGKVLMKFHGAVKSKDLVALLTLLLEGKVGVSEEKGNYRIERVDRETYTDLLDRFVNDLRLRFDQEFGGFSLPSLVGTSFKWPTPMTYEYLLEKGLLLEEVFFSLKKDIEFLYDPVDGGFFNFYDRTRAFDFYFETSKSLSVNSLMISALLTAFERTGNRDFLEKAVGTYEYLKKTLLHSESGCFLNAQISDPSYYNLSPEERKKREPPPTDTAIIVEDNAKAILALLKLSKVTGEDRYRSEALGCLRFILKNLLEGDKLYRYYDVERKERGVENFGRDIAYLALALSHFPEMEGELKRVLSLKPRRSDWVSESIIAYVLSKIDPEKARNRLEGLEINLHYHNPDDMVFLLRSLEVLIESDFRSSIIINYGKGLRLRHDLKGRISG